MLLVPPFTFPRQVNNAGDVSTSGPTGTTYTAGANDAKGSVTQILSALDFDAQLVVVQIGANFLSTTDTSTLTDIVIDPAGGSSWDTTNILIPDLLSGWTATGSASPRTFVFPLHIPAGASIGARGQTARGSTASVPVMIWVFGGVRPDQWWCGRKVDAIGIDAANSRGTQHAPGNSNAFSSWTDFGSTAARNYGALVFMTQGASTDTNVVSRGLRFQIGIGGVQLGPDFWTVMLGDERMTGLQPAVPILVPIPEGTQLQVRAAGSGTASESIDVAAYGVY